MAAGRPDDVLPHGLAVAALDEQRHADGVGYLQQEIPYRVGDVVLGRLVLAQDAQDHHRQHQVGEVEEDLGDVVAEGELQRGLDELRVDLELQRDEPSQQVQDDQTDHHVHGADGREDAEGAQEGQRDQQRQPEDQYQVLQEAELGLPHGDEGRGADLRHDAHRDVAQEHGRVGGRLDEGQLRREDP